MEIQWGEEGTIQRVKKHMIIEVEEVTLRYFVDSSWEPHGIYFVVEKQHNRGKCEMPEDSSQMMNGSFMRTLTSCLRGTLRTNEEQHRIWMKESGFGMI